MVEVLEKNVREIFWSYRNPEDIAHLPLSKLEELARYAIGKILSDERKSKACTIVIAIGDPALRYLFPALEHDSSNITLDAILTIAEKDKKGADTAAKIAVGALHNYVIRSKAQQVILATGGISPQYLVHALGDPSIAEYAEEMLINLSQNGYVANVAKELQRALRAHKRYRHLGDLALTRASQILSTLPQPL